MPSNLFTYCFAGENVVRCNLNQTFVNRLFEKGLDKEFSKEMEELFYKYILKTGTIVYFQQAFFNEIRQNKEWFMDFDKSRVYTAVNADELHEGDLCILADSLRVLKECVKNDIGIRKPFAIREENESKRFVLEDNNWGNLCYHLAYLVCPARNVEAYKAWKEGKAVEVSFNGGKTWVLWKRESDDKIPYREPDWCTADYRLAVEQPKEKKYRPFKDCKELCDFWYTKTAVNVPSYAMPLIWVKRKYANCTMLITAFNDDTFPAISVDSVTYTFADLLEEFTFLDGTPCGVEE